MQVHMEDWNWRDNQEWAAQEEHVRDPCYAQFPQGERREEGNTRTREGKGSIEGQVIAGWPKQGEIIQEATGDWEPNWYGKTNATAQWYRAR